MQPTCIRPLTLVQPSFTTRSVTHRPNIHVYVRQTRHNQNSSSQSGPAGSASSKLFADAAKEEAEEAAKASKSARISVLEQQHENWTGEESIKDAVLRMLVDKYKPLRTGTIQSAEQKLKQNPPRLAPAFGVVNVEPPTTSSPSSTSVNLQPTTGSWATEPLLPSSEGHQPWHTQFKAPSHDVSSIKVAQMPPPVSVKKSTTSPLDDRARRLEREERKRTQQAGRLTQARESTLDYRLGIKGPRGPIGRPNPVSMKGWNGLIEDKIEKARKAGLFNTVKGRGQPIVRSMEEYNPFIGREEFLMNRIVQRNNAAPPWVDVQMELETTVNNFREILRAAWIRRTMRVLVMEHPPEILNKLTLEDIKRHRDSEWVAKEKGYHDTAVAELNSLVRKYNGLAPYAVRRAYYTREAEIGRLYDDCAPDIHRLIAERKTDSNLLPGGSGGGGQTSGHGARGQLGNATGGGGNITLLQWLRLLFRHWFGFGN